MDWTEGGLCIEKYDAFVRKMTLPIHDILYEDGHAETPPNGYRSLIEDKVHALYERFKDVCCRREDYPVFVRLLGDKYICLDGKQRLEAGKIFLPQDDQVWSVLLFNTNNPILLNYLRTSDVKLVPKSDGDIYRLVRHFESVENKQLASTYKSKKRSKARFFTGIEAAVSSRLNQLFPFHGLWADFSLGCHRIELSSLVPEVAQYLDQVYECWSSICGACPGTVTVPTVRRLEGRYPQLSSQDASYITERFDNFDVFETVRDKRRRREMLSAVLRYPGRILSLQLLIEDAKIFESAGRMMSHLLPQCYGGSIKASLEACFRVPEAKLAPVNMERGDFHAGYRRVWLGAWKHFPEVRDLPRVDSPRKCVKCSKPQKLQSCRRVLSDFDVSARQVGFENVEILQLAKSRWATKSISGVLEQLTQGGKYTATNMEAAVEAIEPILDRFLHTVEPRQPSPPILSHNLVTPRYKQRFGMPDTQTFAEDKHSLQLEFMYPPSFEGQTFRSIYVSSFGILRDQFRCFFGRDGGISLLEASGDSHSAASSNCDTDGDDLLFTQDGLRSASSSINVSDDIFHDAHEGLGGREVVP